MTLTSSALVPKLSRTWPAPVVGVGVGEGEGDLGAAVLVAAGWGR